jgi:hypothetical protein
MIIAGFLGEDTLPAAAAAATAATTPVTAIPATATPIVPAAAAPVAPAAALAPAASMASMGVISPSRAARNPFKRPASANPNFVPQSLNTGFIPEFEPFPSIMPSPFFPRAPQGIHVSRRAEPQSGGVPTATGTTTLPADPSGQSSIPAGVPSPVKGSMGRMFPPGLIQALGIMPPIRGVRTGRVNPNTLVAAGRKPAL